MARNANSRWAATDVRLPTYEELSSDEEQLGVLEAPLDQPLFVVGPPGSGKTSLAAWRGDALAELYGETPIVTYNRMLRRSLYLVAYEHDIGLRAFTMQRYVWGDYKERTGEYVPTVPPDPYAYDWDTMIERLTGAESDHEALVVDEGQDLPASFFTYASRYIARTLSVFADEEQAIGGRGSTLAEIKDAAGLPDPTILSENHRNTPEIARLAEHFHRGRLPAATVIRAGTGDVPELVGTAGPDATATRIANEFSNRSGSLGVIVGQDTTGESMYSALRKQLQGVRVDRYSNKTRNEDSIDVRRPGVTVLTKDSVKGQEFDTVFILELGRFVPCTTDAEFRAMYMMCTRARDRLFLVYGPGTLSTAANAALPGREVLKR